MSVSVQTDDFDAGAEMAALSAGRDDVGAVASFVGLVRADGRGKVGGEKVGAGETATNAKNTVSEAVAAMTLEHYPGMTERALADIVAEAKTCWPLQAVRVIHRVGRLLPGERIVFVGVAAGHRGDAFAACEFIMDYLKTRAPFWKKEETPQGARWVDARDSDDAAAARWA
jgi:molybdopterin synthase catalytic subunit